jgi:hypothetical protein
VSARKLPTFYEDNEHEQIVPEDRTGGKEEDEEDEDGGGTRSPEENEISRENFIRTPKLPNINSQEGLLSRSSLASSLSRYSTSNSIILPKIDDRFLPK